MSKLREMDLSRLPELNLRNHEQYFKRIRKNLFSDAEADDNGPALPVKPASSVEHIQRRIFPSQLFISKRDIIWPEEEESETELDENGKKKKKKKAKKWEVKMYPKHEYAYPTVGKYEKK